MHYVIVLSTTPVTINTANDSTSTPKMFYLGVDGGCLSLLKQHLIPDLAIGDFDSLDSVCFEKLKQTKTKIYQVPADNKDLTDFELALDWLLTQKDVLTITVYGLTTNQARVQNPLDSVCFEKLKQTKTKIYQVPADNKDLTDFELALDWLLTQKDVLTITVYGWNGGRTDHFLSIMSVFSNPRYAKLIPVMTLVDDTNEISAINATKPCTKQLLPKAAFKYIGFYAATNLEGLTLTGFKYNLPTCNVRVNTCYVSNEFVANNPGQVSLDAGIVIAIYSRA